MADSFLNYQLKEEVVVAGLDAGSLKRVELVCREGSEALTDGLQAASR